MKKRIILAVTIIISMTAVAQDFNKAALVVQEQLTAYNARNSDTFLSSYSDDIVIYEASREVTIKGKKQLKELFGNLFKNNPNLYCYIENRIVSGNIIIDHEKVQFRKGQPIMEFIVMYKVKKGKIAEVTFLKRS
ncbi:steroid delta-isomerase [Kordia sp. TARA_039_SRF]|nr:steroid delta-isomerase [Kordia sp. TARA_039_SRF]